MCATRREPDDDFTVRKVIVGRRPVVTGIACAVTLGVVPRVRISFAAFPPCSQVALGHASEGEVALRAKRQ